MSHETLVLLAKSVAPILLMVAFLIVIFMAYRPSKRTEYKRIARSILPENQAENQAESQTDNQTQSQTDNQAESQAESKK